MRDIVITDVAVITCDDEIRYMGEVGYEFLLIINLEHQPPLSQQL